MWVPFLTYGLVLALMIWIVQRKTINLIFRILIPMVIFLILFLVFYLFKPVFLGDEVWYNQTPYIETIFFFLMLFGMASRYLTKSIEDRREKILRSKEKNKSIQEIQAIKLEFDLWEFSYPFFFSVITFGLLLKQIDIAEITTSNVILSFQTGFFWQTVLKKEIR